MISQLNLTEAEGPLTELQHVALKATRLALRAKAAVASSRISSRVATEHLESVRLPFGCSKNFKNHTDTQVRSHFTRSRPLVVGWPLPLLKHPYCLRFKLPSKLPVQAFEPYFRVAKTILSWRPPHQTDKHMFLEDSRFSVS